MELDPVARDIVLRSIRQAIPSAWRAKCDELRSLGDVTLATYLQETGLELEDVYAGNRSWSALGRAAGLPTDAAGPREEALLRAVGRLLHVDDHERLGAYRSLAEQASPPDPSAFDDRGRRVTRMLIGSLTTLKTSAPLSEGLAELWHHPQVRRELLELLDLLPERVDHLHTPLEIGNVPLAVHARYTRAEILAAFDVGRGVKPPTWQTGVWWDETSQSDLFAFTLDKSAGSFSPNHPLPRLRDQPGTHSLGEPVRDISRQRHRTPLHQPGRTRNERGAVCAAEHRRSSILVPRPGDVRLTSRRTADRNHVAAASPPARRPLRRVRRRGRMRWSGCRSASSLCWCAARHEDGGAGLDHGAPRALVVVQDCGDGDRERPQHVPPGLDEQDDHGHERGRGHSA